METSHTLILVCKDEAQLAQYIFPSFILNKLLNDSSPIFDLHVMLTTTGFQLLMIYSVHIREIHKSYAQQEVTMDTLKVRPW